ncbi:hypothetical protein CUMW_031230, partial [Citrus unshiu]
MVMQPHHGQMMTSHTEIREQMLGKHCKSLQMSENWPRLRSGRRAKVQTSILGDEAPVSGAVLGN